MADMLHRDGILLKHNMTRASAGYVPRLDAADLLEDTRDSKIVKSSGL